MKRTTEISFKEVAKYVIILCCIMIGSIIYATEAGFSRRLVVVTLPFGVGIYFICKKYISEKWYKYILFSVCYWLIAAVFVHRAIDNERIAVAGSDAVVQMYPAMLYIGRLVREFFNALFTENKFTFPMVEWSLGMGENTISTLNYYGMGDPFYLLSGLVSEEYLPYFFTAFYYGRMYLGGLVCIALFHELNENRSTSAYVVGALVYSFSGFSFQSNKFIIFVHAMMYTPMMFLGAEKGLKGKKKGILLLATFLYALSGFFFLYVSSIALAIYVICRLVMQKTNIKQAVYKVFELIAEYLVGLACAAFIFIPSVIGFFSSSRANGFSLEFSIMTLEEIREFILNLFLPQYNNAQVMAMSTIAIISIIWTLTEKKQYGRKTNIFLVFLSMIIPLVSVIMSGGINYDRWELVVVLYGSYLTCIMWDKVEKLTWLQKLVSVVVWLVLLLYGMTTGRTLNDKYGYTLICYFVILIFTVMVFPFLKKWNKLGWIKNIFFVVTVWMIYESWMFIACDWEIHFVRQENVIQELIQKDEDEFYRIDYEKTIDEPRHGMNISFMLDYPGISQYFSIENSHYVDAFGEWETGDRSFVNPGLDYRTVLETLLAVKYFVAHSDNDLLIPYGFERIKNSVDGEWTLYENKYALPVVYMYDKVFDANKYNHDMNGLEKQNVLLQAAAIEEYTGTVPVVAEVQNDLYKGKYSITSLQNGEIKDGVVTVNSGTVMTLTALLKAGCENYLYFDDKLPLKITVDSKYVKYKEPITLGIVSEDVEKQISIEFLSDATFSLDSMNIYYYDFKNYGDYVEKRNDGSIDNISIGTNMIECDVDADKAKILCVAVPYDKGWHAQIDGTDAQIYRMNSMLMGIEIPEGEHSVKLSYITPGLRIGLFISAIAWVIVVCYCVNKKRR